MTQNTSHAVMAQRIEPHDSLDDFPTPPWAVRAFLNYMTQVEAGDVIWEPAANRGYMVKALRERTDHVLATDIHDYGVGFPTHDFLIPYSPISKIDWVITNPPFRLAADFVRRGLEVADGGVAVIVRSVWAESQTRYDGLFRDTPPTLILQHVHRVPMVKGRYDPKASTATGYSWFVWDKYADKDFGTRFDWLPESKADLYREGDK